MIDYLDQIEGAIAARLYYLALAGALCVPDICSALESPDGRTTGARYVDWCKRHLEPVWQCPPSQLALPPHIRLPTHKPTAEECYLLRCSFLHQGTTSHPKSPYARIVFTEPCGTMLVHRNILNDALNLDVGEFVREVVGAARGWQAAASQTPEYQTNIGTMIRRYPEGLPPYIRGLPVIA